VNQQQKENLTRAIEELKNDPTIELIHAEYYAYRPTEEYEDPFEANIDVAVIAKEYALRNECCAIGFLARDHHAGLMQQLLEHNMHTVEELPESIIDSLTSYYGLDQDELMTVQCLNDKNDSDVRKETVIDYLEKRLSAHCGTDKHY
jgi:hypothetical protein